MFLVTYAVLIFLSMPGLAWSASEAEDQASFLAIQTNKTNPLFGYSVGLHSENLDKPVLKTFSTDGCSQSPDSFLGKDIVHCCVQHDIAYWLGGTKRQKEESDQELNLCISQKTNSMVGDAYKAGVSVGGSAGLRNTFRWGYGWDRLRDYSPITDEEMAQAEKLYGKNLILLRRMIDNRQYTVNVELLTLDIADVTRWHDDIIVYYFLKNKLNRRDIITYGQKMDLTSFSFYYIIKLQSCGESPIRIRLNRSRMVADVLELQKRIINMPWSELSKYIANVDDPGNCLK